MLRKLLFFLLFPITLSLFLYFYFRTRAKPQSPSKTFFTSDQLSHYTGENDTLVYLSIVGRVFDVTDGKRHYGPGESYHFFVGKDASRAFVTGKFITEELIPNISDLTLSQINDLNNWLSFYEGKYPEIGILIGHFFNEDGSKTEYYRDFELKLEGSSLEKEKEKDFALRYPKCNSKWAIDKGGEVWCDVETSKIGNVDRGWIGVPRKFYRKPGSRSFECICVKLEEAKEKPDMFKGYEKCEESSSVCTY